MPDLKPLPYADDQPLPFSKRAGVNWERERTGAYIVGRITCHKVGGDPSFTPNPYRPKSGAFYAFNRGWNEQVKRLLDQDFALPGLVPIAGRLHWGGWK